jgi:rod shape-determining protein MreC
VLIAVAFGVMLFGRADPALTERARMALADALAPLFGVVSEPIATIHAAIADAGSLFSLREENITLKANLHWIPDPAPSYVTARVVADAGGVYARAVLLSTGPNKVITKGQIALDERGLVGRVTEIGMRSARVLLLTDINSRIPVTLETSRARAMLVGTNNARPRLMFWPEGVTPIEGERVVTSAEANAFPSGLPVGTVHYTANNVPEVETFARLDRLEVVRIFDYGLTGVQPPESAARPLDRTALGGKRS